MGEAEGRKNAVTVFRIVGEYVPCQTGYEGMERVGETGTGNWQEATRPKKRKRGTVNC